MSDKQGAVRITLVEILSTERDSFPDVAEFMWAEGYAVDSARVLSDRWARVEGADE